VTGVEEEVDLELAHHGLDDVKHDRQEADTWTELKKGSVLSSGTIASMTSSANAHAQAEGPRRPAGSTRFASS
jgi:hypothetical protein